MNNGIKYTSAEIAKNEGVTQRQARRILQNGNDERGWKVVPDHLKPPPRRPERELVCALWETYRRFRTFKFDVWKAQVELEQNEMAKKLEAECKTIDDAFGRLERLTQTWIPLHEDNQP